MQEEKMQSCRLGTVGGQAVLEGVMMKKGDNYAVAVRKEDGEIATHTAEFKSVRKKHKILDLPIIRGVINMVEMLILSIKTLNLSAELSGIDEEMQETKFEKWLKKHFGKSVLDFIMLLSMIIGIALSLFLFVFLPSALTKGFEAVLEEIFIYVDLGIWRNIIEGLLKMAIFIGYLCLTLLMKDIRRTFEYHGAEHKTIFCYEAGKELTPENAKEFSRFHPRCGTSFMFIVILVSILVSSLPIFTWENVFLRFFTKLLFLPLIVGISYELIRLAGKHDNTFTRILSAPGLWIQRITTREPDLEQLEIAIASLNLALTSAPSDGDKANALRQINQSEEAQEASIAPATEQTTEKATKLTPESGWKTERQIEEETEKASKPTKETDASEQ